MEYLGAWGTLIHEKNLKSKSCVRLRLSQKNLVFFGQNSVLNFESNNTIQYCKEE
jgi:hypothetical protein